MELAINRLSIITSVFVLTRLNGVIQHLLPTVFLAGHEGNCLLAPSTQGVVGVLGQYQLLWVLLLLLYLVVILGPTVLLLQLTVGLVRVTAGLGGDGGNEAPSLGVVHCRPRDRVVVAVVADISLSGDGRSHGTVE